MNVNDDESATKVLKGYEKLRNVGKGAYGIAVLHRRLSDDTLVVIKEINMIEMSSAERQMALNEVQILKILNHPNIISYYGSFEKDGVLLIEMEYADGGTLSQFLSRQSQPMKERDILIMFKQVVSAIKYMHGYNILHRDLKTANVFLTKENVIKVGDFGISKVVTTLAQARSVLGTPHYISPEMCEGKEYDEKSDIWALGCILYEMACLQKTFDGTNLPALVNKIMKGLFQPVPSDYSHKFRRLIYDLLQKDPLSRPTAAEIVDVRMAAIMRSSGDVNRCQSNLLNSSTGRSVRSVLYEVTCFQSATSLVPVPLPPKYKIKEVAASNTHFIALTTEFMVYTWGEGVKGQLGSGDVVQWKSSPELVEALRDKNIKMIGAGDGFSVFSSESGMLMTCGDGSFGCLGHDDWRDSLRPKLLEKLLSVDVAAVSCGQQHVCALTANGDVYSWGRGKDGRLGLGDQEDRCSPTRVDIGSRVILQGVRCGGDATMVITSTGTLFACGRNSYNKLGISGRRWPLPFGSQECDKSLRLRRVRCVSERVADVSLGTNHTTLLTVNGEVITMGRNLEGQLGERRVESRSMPRTVKFAHDATITMIKSGATFSIAGTSENEIYFWGTRYRGRSVDESSGAQSYKCNLSFDLKNQETSLTPVELLALYASPKQIEKGEAVVLAGLQATQNGIYVLVDTTAPLAKMSDLSKGNELVIEESECSEDSVDSMGPIPKWIKEEVARSEISWAKLKKTSLIS